MLCRRLLMFKPMQPGLGGYARLQAEDGRTDLQIQLRGLRCRGVRFFGYAGAGEARELGRAEVNPHGEACLAACLPQNALSWLRALLVITDEAAPKPLLIGINGQQSAGGLLDARNAALALCDQLARACTPVPQPEKPPEKPPKPRSAPDSDLPREIFLPAIDPEPYLAAREPPAQPRPQPSGRPVNQLKPLRWPQPFCQVKRYFDSAMPCAPFDMPGWRFVEAARSGGPEGLWVGYLALDGQVRRVAYAQQGEQAAEGFRPVRGRDGKLYQVIGADRSG